jgi:asparagine synthase (glutamine-hydrolysing)
MNYLPNDILVKVDRAAMQYSLETRIPFLDPDLVTAAWSLPMKFKINKGKGKYILREILKKYVPESMFEKPKKGFNVPLDSWFRLSLKEWAYDTLSEHSIKSQKFFNYQFINRLLKDHSSEKKNNGSKIWNLVVMQTWLNKHFD